MRRGPKRGQETPGGLALFGRPLDRPVRRTFLQGLQVHQRPLPDGIGACLGLFVLLAVGRRFAGLLDVLRCRRGRWLLIVVLRNFALVSRHLKISMQAVKKQTKPKQMALMTNSS